MMMQKFVSFIEQHALIQPGQKIILAASGGMDSTVLADLLSKTGHLYALIHCDFSLRGEESDADALFVQQLGERYQCKVFTKKFDTVREASGRRISIQMAARELRYGWFEEVRLAENCDAVATGHHLDDQAETFLINLIRGTGIAGLHGIPVRQGSVIRPLLCATRAEISEYATEHQLEYRVDSSNNEVKYLRNRIRLEVIPLLKSMNPAFADGITDTIRRLNDFEKVGLSALDAWKQEVAIKNGSEWIVAVNALLNTPAPRLCLWFLLSSFGFNEAQAADVLSLTGARRSRRRFLSSSYTLEVRPDVLVIAPRRPSLRCKPITVSEFSHRRQLRKPIPLLFTRFERDSGFVIPGDPSLAALDFEKLQFPLILRHREPGDFFYPLGMGTRKKLSDFFIDNKFTAAMKEEAWLLCSGNEIVWLVGYRIDHRFRITRHTRHVLTVKTTR